MCVSDGEHGRGNQQNGPLVRERHGQEGTDHSPKNRLLSDRCDDIVSKGLQVDQFFPHHVQQLIPCVSVPQDNQWSQEQDCSDEQGQEQGIKQVGVRETCSDQGTKRPVIGWHKRADEKK